MTLKGQNLRVLREISATEASVVAMATSCTITLTNNTDSAETKDDAGMASKPTVVSKGWTVAVESLNVLDAAAMLTAIKNGETFKLVWDETEGTYNHSGLAASYARKGEAYLNDLTLNYNNRENSAKSIQFSGNGPLESASSAEYQTYTTPSESAYTKGQYVRLFLSNDNTAAASAVIAGATTLSVHVSVTLEQVSTKDTQGDWIRQEITSVNFDISTSALVDAGETITSSVAGKKLTDLLTAYENGTPVKFQIANTSGDNQRTKGTVIMSGSVIITQLTINAAVSTTATYDTQLTGYGDYTVAA